ncbi:MAG: ATP-binding protein [Gammaproteobacteria bacterium]|nr:ATP-binding protein [Gammaproteobacteria bacterium]MCW9058428.1 ATP-binding protein [Gammaproteobacteria bacterium]
MHSLYARVTLAALLVLALFLGLAGWTLERAFRDSAGAAVQERLQAQIYGLLAAADLDADDRLVLPERLPEERFQRPGSGLYAQVLQHGEAAIVWRSPSQLLQDLPVPPPLSPGEWRFRHVQVDGNDEGFQLAFGVRWEQESSSLDFTFSVTEDAANYQAQLAEFRHSLWTWFAALALGLLLALVLVLRWGLRPLRQVERDLAAVEAGTREDLGGQYPRELRGLTDNLNALLRSERGRLQRYRDGLADLAHSLKTPLAILRGGQDAQSSREEIQALIREQTGRMDQIVAYQLQRAATSGRSALLQPVPIAPLLERLRQSLGKVYGQRGLRLELRVDPAQLQLRADEADLMELCGNLLDNACKWARTRVLIQATSRAEGTGLELQVEDDGPGIPEDQRDAVLGRGVRVDSTLPGQGIGLAVVCDIVAAYGGTLAIDQSPGLGGARIQVRLPG